jgi:predicted DNA-binding transcriptional regulator YafY
MRHEKAGRLLELARMLAATAEGLTLDEMAERLGVGRRTAERMRDAVRDVFPQLEEVDDPPTRRFRIPAGLDGLYQAPTAEELAALAAAAEVFAQQGAVARAGALKSLEHKVLSATRRGASWRPTWRRCCRPRPSPSRRAPGRSRTRRCWPRCARRCCP